VNFFAFDLDQYNFPGRKTYDFIAERVTGGAMHAVNATAVYFLIGGPYWLERWVWALIACGYYTGRERGFRTPDQVGDVAWVYTLFLATVPMWDGYWTALGAAFGGAIFYQGYIYSRPVCLDYGYMLKHGTGFWTGVLWGDK
jgi:hypothetical protein